MPPKPCGTPTLSEDFERGVSCVEQAQRECVKKGDISLSQTLWNAGTKRGFFERSVRCVEPERKRVWGRLYLPIYIHKKRGTAHKVQFLIINYQNLS